jgi:hypothetical protein
MLTRKEAFGKVGEDTSAPRLWTVSDLAVFLRVSKRKVFADLSRGAIPSLRLPNGHPRFLPDDILLWLQMGCPSADEFFERKRRNPLAFRKECV